MIREMVCVACPLGCQLKATLEDGKVVDVSGNSCKRGIAYANTEVTNPTRSLTTTVAVDNGDMPVIPVKSEDAIPKELMFECMKIINSVRVTAPVKIGQVIVKNILDTGVDIVATNESAAS